MKYLKKYEDLQDVFKVGDYVICHNLEFGHEMREYFESNVGQIESMESEDFDNLRFYYVKYENIPVDIIEHMLQFTKKFDNIMYFCNSDFRLATNKEIEEQKIKNSAYKFNL